MLISLTNRTSSYQLSEKDAQIAQFVVIMPAICTMGLISA